MPSDGDGAISRIQIVVCTEDRNNSKAQLPQVWKSDTGIICPFNPTEFSITYGADFKTEKGSGTDNEEPKTDPKMVYRGPLVQGINVALLFDTTEARDWAKIGTKTYQVGDSVKTSFIDWLFVLTQGRVPSSSDKNAQFRPPKVILRWGNLTQTYYSRRKNKEEHFFLTEIAVTYKLFDNKGTPLRANARLTFKRAIDLMPGTNPTSVGAARKIWQVEAGQTLDWIAYREYGNPALWRRIAKANNLANPRQLRPGQILRLPVVDT